MKYIYGEQVKYKINKLKPEDLEKLRAFSCANEKLDRYIHEELICDGIVDSTDGLPFIVIDEKDGSAIAVFSLAASGIIHKMTNYIHVLPAIKVDILAVDEGYQKMHFDRESQLDADRDNHYYFSDKILCEIIQKCRTIAEEYATAKYIFLYADNKARRFYERNFFSDFAQFMEKEYNMEICKNNPMYIEID